MTRYLISIFQPSAATQPSAEELTKIMADVDAVNTEIKNAGAWVFAGGLDDPSTATVVTTSNGEPVLIDGPYVELKEYLGGFTLIDVDDLDAALHWARRLHGAIGLPMEVRPLYNEF
ncbi:hypothetical protein FOE78_01905 [Microlunatus elymi]|uniref:YCII-related domain-containing protein n=1 Tax=Microlunatus elymi TaxID=2596828 RepID=A0A516PUI1_9ACTN|nr:YciI family protein [Microlunatus elymi]QDP94837.1 hypothetical protein FOE78_01905 [Microlunatus elymi]